MFYNVPLVATLATFYGTSLVLSKLFNYVTLDLVLLDTAYLAGCSSDSHLSFAWTQ